MRIRINLLDSPNPAFKAKAPLRTLGLFLLLFSVLHSPPSIYGQSSFGSGSSEASSLPRPNPAPWRPSFNPIASPTPDTSANDSKTDESRGSLPRSPQTGRATIVNQPGNPSTAGTDNTGWSASGGAVQGVGSTQAINPPRDRIASRPSVDLPGVTRVTRTMSQLPSDSGQIWREYDITPYTSQINTNEQPEKAILDWVLRETGTEMWFTQPMGVLNIDKEKLYVYHTPEIHAVVKGVVDRFVRTRGQIQTIDVNLVTITKPNWRSQAYTMLQPIDVKSPGVEAWLVSKENAAILMGQLSRRSDYKQHSGGRLTNHDGQSFTLDKTRPVQFIRNLRWSPNQTPSYQPLLTTINEGYKLQLSCLTSIDNASIEATIKCDVDQVEKLNNVRVDIPTPAGNQSMNLQIPQLVSWRLHERFRWPSDQVLVLSCGVVANPEPEVNSGGLNIPGLTSAPKRADALLFIDYRGPATGATMPQTANSSGLMQIEKR